MTAARLGALDDRSSRWSAVAALLAVAGVVAAAWFVVTVDSDPSGVLWPLVLAPLAIAFVPVLAPRPRVRLGAALAMGLWILVTGFSIGFLLVPALFAQIGAALGEPG